MAADEMRRDAPHGLTEKLVEALHTEALILADEARAYFDEPGRTERNRLAPADRVLFSCESLKVTTRLMHIVAWLLTRRTFGLRGAADRLARPLGDAMASEDVAITVLPVRARQLIVASRDLHNRVRRVEQEIERGDILDAGPARRLLGRLERAL